MKIEDKIYDILTNCMLVENDQHILYYYSKKHHTLKKVNEVLNIKNTKNIEDFYNNSEIIMAYNTKFRSYEIYEFFHKELMRKYNLNFLELEKIFSNHLGCEKIMMCKKFQSIFHKDFSYNIVISVP